MGKNILFYRGSAGHVESEKASKLLDKAGINYTPVCSDDNWSSIPNPSLDVPGFRLYRGLSGIRRFLLGRSKK